MKNISISFIVYIPSYDAKSILLACKDEEELRSTENISENLRKEEIQYHWRKNEELMR